MRCAMMFRFIQVLCAVLTTVVVSMPKQAHAEVDIFQHNLVSQYCSGTSGEAAVDCLHEIVLGIQHQQREIEAFGTTLHEIRGPLKAAAKQHQNCSYVEVHGRVQTRSASETSGSGLCAPLWNQYSAASKKLMEAACETVSSFRDADLIERLRIDTENSETKYDECFNDHLTSTYEDFANLWNIKSNNDFFREHKGAVLEYETFNLDGQLKFAFRICQNQLQKIAETDEVLAIKLKDLRRCQSLR